MGGHALEEVSCPACVERAVGAANHVDKEVVRGHDGEIKKDARCEVLTSFDIVGGNLFRD